MTIPNIKPIDPIYFMGVDLGQRGSHSAFVTLERFDEPPTFTAALKGADFHRRYIVRQAQRVPLGTPYSQVIATLKTTVTRLKENATCVLVVDESGAGIPIVELMRKEIPCSIIALTITSGHAATAMTVPRAALITKMQVMAERGELEIAASCRDIEALRYELTHLTMSKSSEPDDLALALSLACWRAKPR